MQYKKVLTRVGARSGHKLCRDTPRSDTMALSVATSSHLTAAGAARWDTRTFPVSAARLVICRQTVVLLAHQGCAGFLGRLSDGEPNLHFVWDVPQGSGRIVPV